MKMKESLSIILATSLFYTSCNQVQRTTPSQRPSVTQKASPEQINDVERQMIAEQKAQSNGSSIVNNEQLNAAMGSIMARGDMHIKDSSGKDVSMEEYKLNPSQYFLLFKDKNNDSYTVLNSATGLGAANGLSQAPKDFHIKYKLYSYEGSLNTFSSDKLGKPVVEDAVDLTATASASINNKNQINALIERLKGTDLASHNPSFTNQISDFFFMPTAHADTKDNLLIVAIVFTSVAVLSYIFGFYFIGTISTAVGISFWFLYWFYDEP